MNATEIRKEINQKLDSLEQEELEGAYGALLDYLYSIDHIEKWDDSALEQTEELQANSRRIRNDEGTLWNSLTQKQREELLDAQAESENPENLVDNENVKRAYRKWL